MAGWGSCRERSKGRKPRAITGFSRAEGTLIVRVRELFAGFTTKAVLATYRILFGDSTGQGESVVTRVSG